VSRPGVNRVNNPHLTQEPATISPDQAEYVIQRGQRAADLLANPSFAWIVDDQTSIHLAALVAAPPGPAGADAVAYHHNQQHALTELVSLLQGYVQAGVAQQHVLEALAEDDDLEDAQEDTP
jgi:hypothetical protein